MSKTAYDQNRYCRKPGTDRMRHSNIQMKPFLFVLLIFCVIAFFLSPFPRFIRQKVKGIRKQVVNGVAHRVVPPPRVDYWHILNRIPHQ